MSFWETFVIAVSLSLDAFAVSVCKGATVKKATAKHLLSAGLYFGGFQAVMPLLGYTLGLRFQVLISQVDHWIAFTLLVAIGAGMIYESIKPGEGVDGSFGWRAMVPLAFATSIDALAVGISFALLSVDILTAISLIGAVTLVLSAAGVWVGNRFGGTCKAKAERTGGIVLILMGVKILLQHLGVLPF